MPINTLNSDLAQSTVDLPLLNGTSGRTDTEMRTARGTLSFAVFIVHFILWLPMTAVGLLLLMYRMMFVSRWMGVSGTALGVLNGRWLLHAFGLRSDESARKLALVLPNNSPLGIRLIFAPFYLHYILSGTTIYPAVSVPEHEKLGNIIANRSIYFDNFIERRTDIQQFVILGAGFDTRFYGNNASGTNALTGKKLFELDKANTQQLKRRYLSQAGVASDNVVYVEVDFSSPESDWPASLCRAGFDPTIPAVLLWEGVTMYITREDVLTTMKNISDMAAPGSVLLADIYGTKFQLKKEAGYRASLRTMKEEIQFLLDFKKDARGEIEKFVAETPGLQLGDAHIMGKKSNLGEWMAVVEVLM